jgi:NAD(P)H-flavin reductase
MLVRKYKSKIISIKNQIQGVYTLELTSLTDKYKYHPGQFLHLAVDENYDGIDQWPESRCFSMQSNPDEDNIRITYAIKGRFTKIMEQQLKVGSEIWLKLPYGNLFSQLHNKTNTVFIAGGTGITPFLSLFTHKSFAEYTNPKIYLGFRSIEKNIYKEVLDNLCNTSQIMKFFYENSDGQIDIHQILYENGPESNYFISGPPAMIKSFKNYLIVNGVIIDHIKTDDWD